MITIELSTYEAIVARGEIHARLEDNRKGLETAPGLSRGLFLEHIGAMQKVISKLDAKLDVLGVPREKEY